MYKLLNMYELIDLFSSAVSGGYNMKMSSRELNDRINELKQYHFFTDSGKKRYTNFESYAVIGSIESTKKILFNQLLIYCYEIDGKLYTTYNSNAPHKYNFIGKTEIPNYRKAGKEDRLIELQKNKYDVTSGFYYPCGKPYFISTQR